MGWSCSVERVSSRGEGLRREKERDPAALLFSCTCLLVSLCLSAAAVVVVAAHHRGTYV